MLLNERNFLHHQSSSTHLHTNLDIHTVAIHNICLLKNEGRNERTSYNTNDVLKVNMNILLPKYMAKINDIKQKEILKSNYRWSMLNTNKLCT